jgi:hypothetical protein
VGINYGPTSRCYDLHGDILADDGTGASSITLETICLFSSCAGGVLQMTLDFGGGIRQTVPCPAGARLRRWRPPACA